MDTRTGRFLQWATGQRPRPSAQRASEKPPEEPLQMRAVHDGHSLSLASIPVRTGSTARDGRVIPIAGCVPDLMRHRPQWHRFFGSFLLYQ